MIIFMMQVCESFFASVLDCSRQGGHPPVSRPA